MSLDARRAAHDPRDSRWHHACSAPPTEASGVLNAQSRARDPWDHELVIECEGDAISVRSVGPDGQLGTEDDVG